jgi:hypothetical protein
LNEQLTSPFSLASQFMVERVPCGITNASCLVTVLYHIPDVKLLGDDEVAAVDVTVR